MGYYIFLATVIKLIFLAAIPDSKVHGANMGPIWVLSAPDGPHVGPWTLLLGINWG